jgi:O-antigen/teichoic acid export membrane protein
VNARFLSAIALQSSGPLLLLGLSIGISRLEGPAEQGAFVSAKSWFDVLVAVGCFGFPQSAVIAINRFKASPSRLYTMACLYSLALFPLLFLVSHVLGADLTQTAASTAMFALGAVCVVLVSIWRGILLTIDDGLRFHAITALPAIVWVCTVAIAVATHSQLNSSMHYICASSGILVLILGYVVFPWTDVREKNGLNPDLSQLITNGADVFVVALTASLQAYLCFAWLKQADGLSAAGYFSVAVIVTTAFGFPLQAISPMILNRWSQHDNHHALNAGAGTIATLFMCLVLLVGLTIAAAPWLVPFAFGHSFYDSVPAVQIMLLAVLPMMIVRVGSLRLASLGQFRFNSAIAIGRCLMVLMLLYPITMLFHRANTAAIVATSCVIAEALAALFTQLRIRQLRKSSSISS